MVNPSRVLQIHLVQKEGDFLIILFCELQLVICQPEKNVLRITFKPISTGITQPVVIYYGRYRTIQQLNSLFQRNLE